LKTDDAWVTIVTPCAEADARAQFEVWRLANPEWSQSLEASEIRIDVMRVEGGRTFYRFRVRPRYSRGQR
jgi:hypothetical protein